MYITDGRCRKIIVEHQVDSFKVNASAHKFSTHQHPDLPKTKTFDYIFSLQRMILDGDLSVKWQLIHFLF
jgi:hypothetical protein